MLRAFFVSKKWLLWAFGGGAILFLSLWLQVQMTVAMNSWYGVFYDLLQNAAKYHDNSQEGIRLFISQLVSVKYIVSGFSGNPSFLEIAFPYVLLAIFTGWFTRIYGLRWREAITFDYIPFLAYLLCRICFLIFIRFCLFLCK